MARPMAFAKPTVATDHASAHTAIGAPHSAFTKPTTGTDGASTHVSICSTWRVFAKALRRAV